MDFSPCLTNSDLDPSLGGSKVLKVWKKVRLGIGFKTINEFRQIIEDRNGYICGLTNDIFDDPSFTWAKKESEVSLVIVKARQFGLKKITRTRNSLRKRSSLAFSCVHQNSLFNSISNAAICHQMTVFWLVWSR